MQYIIKKYSQNTYQNLYREFLYIITAQIFVQMLSIKGTCISFSVHAFPDNQTHDLLF